MFNDEEADVRRENARPTEYDAPVKIIRVESRHGVYRKQESAFVFVTICLLTSRICFAVGQREDSELSILKA